MRAVGDHEDVPHTLIPLALAVGLVRDKVYQGRAEADAIATFIAGIVLLYEFSSDPSKRPQPLTRRELEGALFRGGGRELFFIDGRPMKRYLAVNAIDVECVMALLREPQRAAAIRSRYVRLRAQKLKARSRRLRAQAAQLRADGAQLRVAVSSPAAASARIPGTPAPGARSRRRPA